jgi:hypothetical protein
MRWPYVIDNRNTAGITKTRKVAGRRSTLFWVNSDQKSVETGSREETLKRIRSHVMSEHNRRKRLENTRRYKSKTWKSLAFRPGEANSSERSPTFSDGSMSKDSQWASESDDYPFRSPSLSADEGRTPSTQVSRKSSPAATFEVLEWETKSAKGSPWSYVGQGIVDPFVSGLIQLSDRTTGHLQFCKSVLEPGRFC